MKCLIDNTEHADLESLHKHLRKFKVTQAAYYEEYCPRQDLLTGEKIEFKSFDQYFSTRFCNKNNMKKWFKDNPEKNLALAKEMLSDRVKKKGLIYAPMEVELLSSGLPSIAFYEGKGGYASACSEIGVKSLYNYSIDRLDFSNEKLDIVVDTRETKPFKFPRHNIMDLKIEYGDYAVWNGKIKDDLVIERKSLMDLIGSFVTNYDRLDREFTRAKENGAYLIVVCEESLATALAFNYIPFIRRYTKIRPEVLFHNIRNLIQKYQYQFVFCDGVQRATDVTEKIFLCKQDVRKLDLQYMIDKRKLF